MKKRIVLLVIYIAFISLGLPDCLLGSGWPSMFESLGVPVDFGGIIAMIVATGTVVSSLFSGIIIKRYGTAMITAISTLMTAVALLGFAYSQNFIFMCLLCIPLGLGAGSIDVALNNYVALHFKASHMNWLHCFWGVGAAVGPILMGRYLASGKSWTTAFNTVGWIQMALVVVLLLSIPLWIRDKKNETQDGTSKTSFRELLTIPGLKSAMTVFFCYCTLEVTFGLWGASYLVFVRDIEATDAAKWVSLYYIGITVGRLIAGFISLKLNNKTLVKLGQGITILGIIILILPFQSTIIPAFFLIGFGFAPVFPSLLHNTPKNFGKANSEAIVGLQMASAYIGITIMPFLFGKLAASTSFSALIWFLMVVLGVKIYMNLQLNKKVQTKIHQ